MHLYTQINEAAKHPSEFRPAEHDAFPCLVFPKSLPILATFDYELLDSSLPTINKNKVSFLYFFSCWIRWPLIHDVR